MMANNKKVKLCLNMIVRDEEHIMQECLENMQHLIDAIAIVDTGSRDKTVDIINNFMVKNDIPGEVIIQHWKEFGVSRTEALRHGEDVICRVNRRELGPAGKIEKGQQIERISNPENDERYKIKIPNGPLTKDEWLKKVKYGIGPEQTNKYDGTTFLMERLDKYQAEDYTNPIWYLAFHDADNRIYHNDWEKNKKGKFSFDRNRLTVDTYSIDMKQGSRRYAYAWLVKVDPQRRYKWFGARHEYVGPFGNWTPIRHKISGGYILSGREGSRSRNPLKYVDDAVAIQRELLQQPKNDRNMFYLAQSWRDAGTMSGDKNYFTIARECYLRRATLEGNYWVEETYLSWLEAGKLSGLLEPNKPHNFIGYMLKAFEVLPSRFEAPFYIVETARNNKMFHVGWNFAKPLINNPSPSDGLFLDEEINKWKFKDTASICAFYAKDLVTSKRLMEEILKLDCLPCDIRKRIENNLTFFK